MIKKIVFILSLFILITSCGKKGDPVYEKPKKKAKTEIILINKA